MTDLQEYRCQRQYRRSIFVKYETSLNNEHYADLKFHKMQIYQFCLRDILYVTEIHWTDWELSDSSCMHFNPQIQRRASNLVIPAEIENTTLKIKTKRQCSNKYSYKVSSSTLQQLQENEA